MDMKVSYSESKGLQLSLCQNRVKGGSIPARNHVTIEWVLGAAIRGLGITPPPIDVALHAQSPNTHFPSSLVYSGTP